MSSPPSPLLLFLLLPQIEELEGAPKMLALNNKVVYIGGQVKPCRQFSEKKFDLMHWY